LIWNTIIPVIHASYKGKLKSDKTITGTFTQGMPIPLNLEKGEADNANLLCVYFFSAAQVIDGSFRVRCEILVGGCCMVAL